MIERANAMLPDLFTLTYTATQAGNRKGVPAKLASDTPIDGTLKIKSASSASFCATVKLQSKAERKN